MNSVFEELKRAREAKHLSVEDVSDATLINATFLEAIERGNTTVLPQTYVRAFIREYASFVGLDPQEIMRQYDLANTEKPAPREAEVKPAAGPPGPPEQKEEGDRSPSLPSFTPTVSKLALPALLIIILAVVIWNLSRTKAPPPERETTVEDISRNRPVADSIAKSPAANRAATASDSLTLRAIVSDSAWVQITIDDQKPLQYLFKPNRRIEWKARERFLLSTGNAGAIDLTLNNKHLGAPGKRRAIIRSVEFNRRTLLPQ